MLINMHPFFQDPQAGDAPHGLGDSLNAHFQGVSETDRGFDNGLVDLVSPLLALRWAFTSIQNKDHFHLHPKSVDFVILH